MRSFALVALLFCHFFSLRAQEDLLHFFNITRDDGLAQATVNQVIEGSEGFMWFATAEGLHRYDGYKFKIFKHHLRDTNSLSNDHIIAICEDKKKNIWIGSYTGDLNKFNKETQQVERLLILDQEGQANRYPISCISLDRDGSILVGLDGGGMVVYHPETKVQNHYHSLNSNLPNNYVKSFNKEANGLGYWIGTAQGMVLYQEGQFKTFSSLKLFENQFVSDVLHVEDKVYITTFGQGLKIWDTKSDILTSIEPPFFKGARFLNFVEQDHEGTIWVGTEGGGLLKLTDSGFKRYRNTPFDGQSLVGDNVKCALRDSRGMMWFGCINGISRFDPSYRLFELYRNFVYQDKVTNNNVYCIYEDRDGIIWLGTLSGGLVRFNPNTGEIKVYPLVYDGNVETKSVRAIYQDRAGVLWIGTRDEGLFSFDKTSEKFTHYRVKEDINLKTIRCIFEDSESKLWIGSSWGLILFDRETKEYSSYYTSYLKNNPIYQIVEDEKRNELILCTFRSGLQIFHKGREAFTVLKHAADSLSPSVNALMCIEKIGNDSFLIGTYGGGLNIFNRENMQFRSITTLDGLPNNVIYGILPESKYVYWLSSNDGLIRYDIKTMSFRRFDLNYYLQGLEFNEGAYWKSRNGFLYFGGPDGFNRFNPDDFPIKDHKTNVVLTDFKKLNEEVNLIKGINYLNEVEVEYNANLISFEFAALNFSGENSYAYKLDGFDGDWIHTGKERTAYYTRLSPGIYTFKVKAASGSGEFGEVFDALKVIVNPPFWKTWWFMSLAVLAALALIFLIVQIRTKAIGREYKHRVVELELRALRSQMNPHFIFNSLNSIQYYVLKNEPKQAYTYLTKFSNLMRMILQNSRRRFISLKAEVDWLRTYLDLEKLRMENELNYEVHIDDNIDTENVFVPAMLLQPYVENAIIHGLLPKEGNRELLIAFQSERQQLICRIKDNGIGREQSAILNEQRTNKHKSQGLKLTGERLDMLRITGKRKPVFSITDLHDDEGISTGTQIEIILPIIGKSDIKEDE